MHFFCGMLLSAFVLLCNVGFPQSADTLQARYGASSLIELLQENVAFAKKYNHPISNTSCDLLERINESGIYALDTTKIEQGDVEIRLWMERNIEPGKAQGYIVRRIDGKWSGIYIKPIYYFLDPLGRIFNLGRIAKNQQVYPDIGWTAFWDSLQGYDILTLPDGSTLESRKDFNDGIIYYVETKIGNSYRFFSYFNPQSVETPEKEKMCKVINLFCKGLK